MKIRALSMVSIVVLLLTCSIAESVNRNGEVLRQQLEIQQALLVDQLEELRTHRGAVEDAWVRIERESADHLRAEEQDETPESLRLRDQDLRLAESELMMHIMEAQRLRRALIATRALIAKTEEEIAKVESAVGPAQDPITGTWDVVVDPGGIEGQFSLELDGTLVQGTYRLNGGWVGSLRGTLVAGKVRLERIDQQIGFAAIFYGQLMTSDGQSRLQGRWEATQLASGLPSAGAWVAERKNEEDD